MPGHSGFSVEHSVVSLRAKIRERRVFEARFFFRQIKDGLEPGEREALAQELAELLASVDRLRHLARTAAAEGHREEALTRYREIEALAVDVPGLVEEKKALEDTEVLFARIAARAVEDRPEPAPAPEQRVAVEIQTVPPPDPLAKPELVWEKEPELMPVPEPQPEPEPVPAAAAEPVQVTAPEPERPEMNPPVIRDRARERLVTAGSRLYAEIKAVSREIGGRLAGALTQVGTFVGRVATGASTRINRWRGRVLTVLAQAFTRCRSLVLAAKNRSDPSQRLWWTAAASALVLALALVFYLRGEKQESVLPAVPPSAQTIHIRPLVPEPSLQPLPPGQDAPVPAAVPEAPPPQPVAEPGSASPGRRE